MEASFKRGFRTYGGQKIFLSIIISPAKSTPMATRNYIQTKVKLLNTGVIRSSPQAQARICQFRQHDFGTCPSWTLQDDKAQVSAIPSVYEDDD